MLLELLFFCRQMIVLVKGKCSSGLCSDDKRVQTSIAQCKISLGKHFAVSFLLYRSCAGAALQQFRGFSSSCSRASSENQWQYFLLTKRQPEPCGVLAAGDGEELSFCHIEEQGEKSRGGVGSRLCTPLVRYRIFVHLTKSLCRKCQSRLEDGLHLLLWFLLL